MERGGMKIIAITCLFFWAATTIAWGRITRGSLYTYDRRIWNEAFSQDGIRIIAEQTVDVLKETIKVLNLDNGMPERLRTPDDIHNLSKFQRNLSAVISTINSFMKEHRQEANSEFQRGDLLPDALIVYFGPKAGFSLVKGGIEGSVLFGIIVIPQIVNKISNHTGEIVDTYPEFDFGLVVWPQVGGGILPGLGGGPAASVGMALLWNTRDDIEDIDDIANGVGFGFQLLLFCRCGNNRRCWNDF